VRSVQTAAEGLYEDWDADGLRALRYIVGSLPRYAVIADVGGRIPGDREVASFLRSVIGRGGYAMDDYSDDVWTLRTDRRRSTHPRRARVLPPGSHLTTPGPPARPLTTVTRPTTSRRHRRATADQPPYRRQRPAR
jgi:hypothetical protein